MSDDESKVREICCYLFYESGPSTAVEAILSWRGGVVDVAMAFIEFDIPPVGGFFELGRAYKNDPNLIRKQCRMKFSSCRKHDATAVFVQILFLSNNYFVICSSAQ